MPKPKSKGDNADGSRQDAQNNAAAPVLRSSWEARSLQTACDARRECGDLFLLLHLLEPLAAADDLLKRYPDFFVYAGDDCANRWATFLRDPRRPDELPGRLREADSLFGRTVFRMKKKETRPAAQALLGPTTPPSESPRPVEVRCQTGQQLLSLGVLPDDPCASPGPFRGDQRASRGLRAVAEGCR